MALPSSKHHEPNLAVKGAKGAVIVDGKHVGDTLRCVHCSAHWVHQEGSGIRRGWCLNCKGPICGSPLCDDCIPLESRLEGWEQGKTKKQVMNELAAMPKSVVIGGHDLTK